MDLAGKSASLPRRRLLNRPSRGCGANGIGSCLPAPSAYLPLDQEMRPTGIAIIGCGGITLQNHLPGLALCPEAKVVALCDNDAGTLQKASRQTGINVTTTQYEEIMKRKDVEAVIIATPNFAHAPIALAAIAAGKHVLCEKPLAMSYAEAKQMADAADRAGVRHMT